MYHGLKLLKMIFVYLFTISSDPVNLLWLFFNALAVRVGS